MAPLVYRLARGKSLSVAKAILNGRWLCGLSKISNEEQLHQFFHLWAKIDEVRLNSAPDSIQWLPEANGSYSAKSAYDFQFIGTIQQPRLEKIWKSNIEGKIKFYLWLLLRNRNWTADRLSNRGMTCNPICSLCDQEPESAAHLTVGCSFVKEVWAAFATSNPTMARLCSQALTVRAW
jgi:hypothetical protein